MSIENLANFGTGKELLLADSVKELFERRGNYTTAVNRLTRALPENMRNMRLSDIAGELDKRHIAALRVAIAGMSNEETFEAVQTLIESVWHAGAPDVQQIKIEETL